MKKLYTIILLFVFTVPVIAQTDGISYQAVIIDPKIQELPGVDVSGNFLPGSRVAMRFTIYDATNTEEYQEIHVTNTDQFGMVNLMIGQGEPTNLGTGDFTLISWDGTSKSLQVEINFDGETTDFEDMNRQELTFVPYAFHRNITATGDLTVDGTSDLNGRLLVQGPTNLNSTLNVNNENATNLSGTLDVLGNSALGDNLSVAGATDLNDSLRINDQSPVFFSGDITVAAEGTATFNGPTIFNSPANFNEISVAGPSNLNGQVTVRANMDSVGGDDEYLAYPLLVEGSKQGIAIRINEGRSIDNNYISFWDTDQMWGRIEGITSAEQNDDPEYITELAVRTTDVIINGIEAVVAGLESGQAVVKLTAAGTSSTACAGFGACVTAPIPSLIAESSTNLVLKIANAVTIGGNLILAIGEEAAFIAYSKANIGVSYQSGAGDYAEWLPKENPSDEFLAGELIGVKNGVVTKNTWGAEKIMVVSTRPIVLGNMPKDGEENGFVKVAFMGQVPVRVIGPVTPGDFILPSEIGNGFAKAVSPVNMKTRDYKKVGGVVWSVMDKISDNISIVNCAVGMNTNDLSDALAKQEAELDALKAEYTALKSQMSQTNAILTQLVPGYAEAQGIDINTDAIKTHQVTQSKIQVQDNDLVHSSEQDVVYFEISRDQIEEAIIMAREQYMDLYNDKAMKNILFGRPSDTNGPLQASAGDIENMVLMDISEHPFWQKIDNDPTYKEEIIELLMSKLDKAYHTHQEHAHKFTNLQMKH